MSSIFVNRYIPWTIILFVLPGVMGISEADDKVPNEGQDFTRPLRRLDLRWNYSDEFDGALSHFFTLRGDHPVQLSKTWQQNFRFDMPVVFNRLPGESSGKWGSGDLDVQTNWIHTFNSRYAAGGGIRMVFPTASEERFGSERYQMLVGSAFRIFIPEISSGSFFAPQLQYNFDVGGDSSSPSISILRIVPTFNISLPDDQFLTFLDSADIRYDFNTKKWFVPIDATYGKRWGNLLTTIQVSYPIVDDMRLYEVSTTMRIGYFF